MLVIDLCSKYVQRISIESNILSFFLILFLLLSIIVFVKCLRILSYLISWYTYPFISIGKKVPRANHWSKPHLGLTRKGKKLALNARHRLLKTLLTNKHTKLNTKLLIYKSLVKPTWTYGLQLWGNAKKSNLNKIQITQNKIIRSITSAPHYVSNFSIHSGLKIKTIHEEAKSFYKRFFHKMPSHPNPLIPGLTRFLETHHDV